MPACIRKGCNALMCDYYSRHRGYLCHGCREEILDMPDTDITTFLATAKKRKVQERDSRWVETVENTFPNIKDSCMVVDSVFNAPAALLVRFKGCIDADGFEEKGMLAWLTGAEWNDKLHCYQIYFDFSSFRDYNKKYFRRNYYGKDGQPYVTAIEAGCYEEKYRCYFSPEGSNERDDTAFDRDILNFIEVLAVDNLDMTSVLKTLKSLLEKQEPLGEEFQRVLQDNYNALLVKGK